ncbi:hypothetical protein ACOMHN_040761 [Nucella lapillus]
MACYEPTPAKQQKLDVAQSSWMRPHGSTWQPLRSSSYSGDAPSLVGYPPRPPLMLQPSYLAERKRQSHSFGDGSDDTSEGSSQHANEESQTFYGPSSSKQQKLEMLSPILGSHQSFRHDAGSRNSFFGSYSQPSPILHPGRPPNPPPLRTVNSWLPAGKASGNDGLKQAGSILPEIPAEQDRERISTGLNTLNRGYSMFKSSGLGNFRIHEFRNKWMRIQDEMKWQRERQQVENLQLSKQLAQQYNLSFGSTTSSQSKISPKKKRNSDSHSESRNKGDMDTEVSALSDNIEKLTKERSVVDSKIEILMCEDWTEQIQRTIDRLTKRQKLVDRKLAVVTKKRSKLLEQSVPKFDTDAFIVLGKLAKDMQTWRDFKHSELIAAQNELSRSGMDWQASNMVDESVEKKIEKEPVTSVSSSVHCEQADVIVISDEDVMAADWNNRNTHQQKQESSKQESSSCEKRPKKMPKSVRLIDKCVTQSGLTAEADQSLFLLSGLSSTLLRRQRERKLTQTQTGNEQSTTTCDVQESCPVSQLIGQMTSKLKLLPRYQAKVSTVNEQKTERHQEKQDQDKTVNLYMKIHNEEG